MRTKKETEAEAYRRASQAMTAAGWGVSFVSMMGKLMEEQYWEEFGEAYEDATFDLEAENETSN